MEWWREDILIQTSVRMIIIHNLKVLTKFILAVKDLLDEYMDKLKL